MLRPYVRKPLGVALCYFEGSHFICLNFPKSKP